MLTRTLAFLATASLLHGVSLIPFETQAPSELDGCFADEASSSGTAHLLFWLQVLMLPLLSLNALVAIMNNSFQVSMLNECIISIS